MINQEPRSGSEPFRPRARLLKLIGAELISDDVLAVTELVKNAHDADASSVTLEFHRVTQPDGEIVIRDDGHGMGLDALLKHWMEPAGTSKIGAGRRTVLGRRVLGEKGVGRFAADKLGRKLELISRRAREREEVRAVFEWDAFESDSAMLSDIRNAWELRRATAIKTRGTILRITGLRSQWTERMFRRLSTRLSRLRSPFAERDGFRIQIESDEFPHYAGELKTEFLDRAPYHLDARFDGLRHFQVKLNGARVVEHEWNGASDLTCGPVRVRLYAFDLETDAVARIGPRMDVRAWLKEWSGVSVYRDGFRVWPYGEPHDDWLRLDQRRVNNPVVRLSNNQVVGFVEITGDSNPGLSDQTNREGLIHNVALDDLRRLLHHVLQILEAERQSIRHPALRRTGPSPTTATKTESLTAVIGRLAKATPQLAPELGRLERRLSEELALREDTHQRLVQGYAELAAAGQVASGISRSVQPVMDRLRNECSRLRGELNGSGTRSTSQAIRAMEESIAALAERLTLLAPMQGNATLRRRAIDVVSELDAAKESLAPLLDERGVKMDIVGARSGIIRAEIRPEVFHRLVYILTSNSIEWFRRVADPAIRVTVGGGGERCEIVFADNGPGMPAEVARVAFEPLFSTKEGGRGMGLAIARNIVVQHGGSIEAIVDGRRKGATIRISLPRKRSRATVHAN